MQLHLDTQLLYEGTQPCGEIRNPEVPAIYPSTAYILDDMEDYDFANRGGRYYYNRSANPNRDELGQAISSLEHGGGTLICSSGMAAITTVLLGLLHQGDHVLMSQAIYGETIELAGDLLRGFGIEVSYADFTDAANVERGLRPNTKLVYTEIIANPLTLVVDLDAVSAAAKRAGVLTVVDSTFTTPFVYRPLEHGADIVIHSLTKYFGGHSDITGGSVTASRELIAKLLPRYLLLGCCLDPNTSWLTLRSIKTMGMRVRRQNENAAALAKALSEDSRVRAVYHPSLETHPQHALAARVFETGYGAMMSFRVEDSHEKVSDFMHRLKLVKYLGTLGGIRTTYTHPATAFRNEFSRQELEEMGMYEGLIRISTGAEDIRDLIADFSQALKAFD
jgi:Cystathionine beta-lyases/cystathionine gamma-synthases